MPFGIPSEDFCGGFGITHDENNLAEEKISKIKNLLKEIDGVADSQEFGLNYGQAISYLDKIKEISEM